MNENTTLFEDEAIEIIVAKVNMEAWLTHT